MEQIGHDGFFKNAVFGEEVFADIDPDDIFVVAEFYDFGINFFVLDTAGIFVVFAAGEDCVEKDFRIGIKFADIIDNAFDTCSGGFGFDTVVGTDHNGDELRFDLFKDAAFFDDPEGVLSAVAAAAEVENGVGVEVSGFSFCGGFVFPLMSD